MKTFLAGYGYPAEISSKKYGPSIATNMKHLYWIAAHTAHNYHGKPIGTTSIHVYAEESVPQNIQHELRRIADEKLRHIYNRQFEQGKTDTEQPEEGNATLHNQNGERI